MLTIGRIVGIQENYKDVNEAKKGAEICIKVEQQRNAIPQIQYGRHFDHQSGDLVSQVSPSSFVANVLLYTCLCWLRS
jgi:translation initiation factor IF-2